LGFENSINIFNAICPFNRSVKGFSFGMCYLHNLTISLGIICDPLLVVDSPSLSELIGVFLDSLLQQIVGTNLTNWFAALSVLLPERKIL
jgi:hypothetical protein